MIRLERIGTGASGLPLVMVPGIDGSGGSVIPIAQALAADRLVFIADYSGEDNPTVEALTAEIAGQIAASVPGPFDLFGQSIGTIPAAQIASAGALPVRKLVLCCTFTRLRWTALRVSNALVAITPRWLFAATAPGLMKLVCGPVGDGGNHPFFEASRRADKHGVMKRTAWQIDRDFSPDIAAVQLPMLVLMGEQDRFVPDLGREVEKLRALLAGRPAALHTVAQAGHVFIPSQAVASAARLISEFLRADSPEAGHAPSSPAPGSEKP